jgi:hypothetical protein
MHDAQPPSLFTLTPTQLKALDLLLSGLPDVHVAQALNIHRTTIYRWKTLHPAFVAEYNRLRIDAWDACHQRLRHLLPRALSALGKGLRSDDPSVALRSATTLLRHAAPDKDVLPPPPERKTPTTPDAFIDAFVQAHRRAKGKDPHKPITDKERDPVVQSLLRHLSAPDH